MQFIGGVQGLTFNPVEQYNKMLGTSKSLNANGAMPEITDFDKVLNQQTASLNNDVQPTQIAGGVAMDRVAEMDNTQGIQSVSTDNNTGSLMNDLSKSFSSGLNSVNDLQESANKAQEALATGQNVSVHDVMIASEKATMGLQMALQLRNKLLNAYSEINNVKV